MKQYAGGGWYWFARSVRALVARLELPRFLLARMWLQCSCAGLSLVARGQRFSWACRIRVTDLGSLSIGHAVVVSRGAEITVQGGSVSIDSSTFIGPWTTIVAKESIVIGTRCADCRTRDHS